MFDMMSSGRLASNNESGKNERLLVVSVGLGRDGCKIVRPGIKYFFDAFVLTVYLLVLRAFWYIWSVLGEGVRGTGTHLSLRWHRLSNLTNIEWKRPSQYWTLLSSSENEAWKLNPWPLRCWCNALPTEPVFCEKKRRKNRNDKTQPVVQWFWSRT